MLKQSEVESSKRLSNYSRCQWMVLFMVLLGPAVGADQTDLAVDQQMTSLQLQARSTAMSLGSELKSKLQQAIAKDGLAHAVEFCHLNAQGLTRQQAITLSTKVSRTSLKVRNPANTADVWQQSVLEDFADQQQQGIPISAMEFGEISEQDGDSIYRFMKAIPTQGLCLGCHGDSIAPEVATRIQQFYPDDQATGFQVGDIRGAFYVEINLSRD
ncbi:DUF3365 domain-containing protein [Aestuariicella sp. G3-2]|uniref:Tll0287-like domain-containing protein n=1 Tax=Pseudomaricurvus albidus TaxID=2842452 RepID=UPI001C0B568D|nr:DUF3365 domain-containing protein [Aestuariicella albida]